LGIGGGIITRKLLFTVLLISSLSLSGIAGVSAVDDGTAQTQTDNNINVEKKANIETNNINNVNKSAKPQNSADEEVKTVENTSTAITDASFNQTADKKHETTQETALTNIDQTVTPTNSKSQNSANTETNKQNAVQDADDNCQNSENTSSNPANDTTNSQEQYAAAGETKTPASFTLNQIKDAAAKVKSFIETNKRLPNYVTIGTTQIQMPDFLKLLTAGLLQLNSGKTTPIALKTVNDPAKPSESIKSGDLTKAGYLDLAKRVNAFIDANGVLPNYANSNLGKLRYESLIYIFSKILNFQNSSNRLPNYVTVKPWSTVGTSSTTGSAPIPVPTELQQYLKATTNCQVTNAQIQALATKITSGKTSAYDKAVAIFNWVRDNISYSFYYNTKRGAVGTLNAKSGNCVDTTHLLIALSRAAGIPARYRHGTCKFTSGNTYGHVWAQIWVDGKWYAADATSSRNSFGVINNWNTATYTLKGTYASLSF